MLLVAIFPDFLAFSNPRVPPGFCLFHVFASELYFGWLLSVQFFAFFGQFFLTLHMSQYTQFHKRVTGIVVEERIMTCSMRILFLVLWYKIVNKFVGWGIGRFDDNTRSARDEGGLIIGELKNESIQQIRVR